MNHRHLDYDPSTAVESLGPAALDDLLERGDLADWAPLARAISRDPFGDLAVTVEQLCDAHPLYGTSPLWRSFLDRARVRLEGSRHPVLDLRALRRARGLSQTELARRLGISQSDLSKLERRSDVRLSTLRAYVAALGGNLAVVAEFAGTIPAEVTLGPQSVRPNSA